MALQIFHHPRETRDVVCQACSSKFLDLYRIKDTVPDYHGEKRSYLLCEACIMKACHDAIMESNP